MLTPTIILVAERSLSADYRILFEGIFATMQTTRAPALLMRHLLAPPMPTDADGRALAAPLGLRRLEAALRRDGWTADEVVVTTPEALPELLGPATRLVGVSSSDPLGQGMSNTTTNAFCPGPLYTRLWTAELLAVLRQARQKLDFRVLFGGAGAWQYARDPEAAAEQGIDGVCRGYADGPEGVALLRQLAGGVAAPPVVEVAGPTAAEAIPPILAPSLMGVIELSRGCGKGCTFCSMAGEKMLHLPIDTVLADARTNVAGGQRNIVSGSEDLFRYGARGVGVNPERLLALLAALREVAGLRFMQIDHANISSILQYRDDQLREARRLLTWETPTDYLWVNMGLESANGQLVAATGAGKIKPFDPDNWEEMAREACDKTLRTGFFPVFSVVLGLPGETPDDVGRTHRLVADLGRRGAVVFPIFHEPLRAGEPAFGLETMRMDHYELFRACYEINFRAVPKLYWDNQRAGGVPLGKRLLIQTMGRAEVLTWRHTFRRIRRRLQTR